MNLWQTLIPPELYAGVHFLEVGGAKATQMRMVDLTRLTWSVERATVKGLCGLCMADLLSRVLQNAPVLLAGRTRGPTGG
jgi:tetrahydromethanopterin S-methyltransferase subunit D